LSYGVDTVNSLLLSKYLSCGRYFFTEQDENTNAKDINTNNNFDRSLNMLSKNQLKQIQFLSLKKKRMELGLFTVEGSKSVIELLRSKIEVKSLIATSEWMHSYKEQLEQFQIESFEATIDELNKLTNLSTPPDVLAVAVLPIYTQLPDPYSSFVLALDSIQDPGNLGAIIRIADWYGINQIVTCNHTVEWHNPKCIQASMGSFARVKVIKTDLANYLQNHTACSIIGAVLEGESLYQTSIPQNGILLIGNEGHGIKPEHMLCVNKFITIPRVGQAESLNAAIATAILCDARARMLQSQ
jgi:TrmH family RNA methyltransferase